MGVKIDLTDVTVRPKHPGNSEQDRKVKVVALEVFFCVNPVFNECSFHF